MQQFYCCIILLLHLLIPNNEQCHFVTWEPTIFVVAHLIITRTIFFVLRRSKETNTVLSRTEETNSQKEKTAAMERGTSSCGPPVAQTMDDLPEEENTADNFNDVRHGVYSCSRQYIQSTPQFEPGLAFVFESQHNCFWLCVIRETVNRAVTKTENDHTYVSGR